jgi:D-amino-acid dehydrogenase
MKTDCIVLGAGMVGIATALHLQARGRDVVLIDRRGAAEETSYGNAGLIQREGVVPYTFPRDMRKMLDYALNRTAEANLHYSALPTVLPWLYRYFRYSTPERIAASAHALRPLIERCVIEHDDLMVAADCQALARRTGYVRLFRDHAGFDEAITEQAAHKASYGINYDVWDTAALRTNEPHITGPYVGAVHLPDPVSISDPGALGKGYASLFKQRGGRFLTGDARTLEAATQGGGPSGNGADYHWQVQNVDGPILAKDVVIALGPWSAELLRPLVRSQNYSIPLGVKRGYHMHYAAKGNATLNRPVIDSTYGFLLSPMTKGIRMTTGAEFARVDAPSTPVQIDKCEPQARAAFPLADRAEPTPWLGCRPCFPDMLPMVGPVPGNPGLWVNAGHHHLGFTLGPVTGRLLAEMMTGAETLTDPYPYRVGRFG